MGKRIMVRLCLVVFVMFFLNGSLFVYGFCLQNTYARKNYTSLNGEWQYIIDPYETGFYNYRREQRYPTDPEAYWNSDVPRDKSQRIEFGYSTKNTLKVPGDWNSQNPIFLYYEGSVWYRKSFDYSKKAEKNTVYLHFGAVNYRADVFLNGVMLGTHLGGFTSFGYYLPDSLLKAKDNTLTVRVDNKRLADEIPTINTDWWNYGGITRDVALIELPKNHIQDYKLYTEGNAIKGFVKLAENKASNQVTIEIPELSARLSIKANSDSLIFNIPVKKLTKWSPELPKLYTVKISTQTDTLNDKIGFKTIETQGKNLLLNGKSLFMRGICIHEEIAEERRRAHSKADALKLLKMAKDMNCNMVRLAHYPHNEWMLKVADSLGLIVWSEIPVYWTIQFGSNTVYNKAETQLKEMIFRDKNRVSIAIWSVGNETPKTEERLTFMKKLAQTAKKLDSTRLISAACEVHFLPEKPNTFMIDDPLGQYLDVVSVNEYLGWYWGIPTDCRDKNFEIKYDKPFFISEMGAEAKEGFYGDTLTRWSEDYQAWFYKEQLKMLDKIGKQWVGISPWLMTDFSSPKRNHPVFQAGWNNKGLISSSGKKKKAYDELKNFYHQKSIKK